MKKALILLLLSSFVVSGCVRYSGGEPVEDEEKEEAMETATETTESVDRDESGENETVEAEIAAEAETQVAVPDFKIIEEDLNDVGIYAVTLETDSTDEKEIESLIRHTVTIANDKNTEVNSINVAVRQMNVDALNIATGRIALTDKGLAQTGFTEVPEIEINLIMDNVVDTSKIADSESSYTADDVVKAFEENGLSVPNPRDNTDKHCVEMPCSQLVTTDTVSIYQWEDAATAEEMFNEGFGSFQAETFTIRFNEEVDEASYNDALTNLVN